MNCASLSRLSHATRCFRSDRLRRIAHRAAIPPCMRASIRPLPSLIHLRTYADSRLDLVALDKKWQEIWRQQYESQKDDVEWEEKEKMYILPMFPYPSGMLHMGHLRNYTVADVIARFRRMQGYDVLHAMGWDAFGLPAENAAIERGLDPAKWTEDNIEKMKVQLQTMNGSWDWSREIKTCEPKFFKHTQRLFLLLHQHGLAYQAEATVNWDPVDKTVLANEQVDANGISWRSGAKVEKKRLKQWFFKTSAFRDALLEDMEILAKDGRWPERVLSMQKNWLGKSKGARVKFPVLVYDPVLAYYQKTHGNIEVFTTRPDTLFGVQYVALSASHPIVTELAMTDAELRSFLDSMPALPQDSKEGYVLKGVRAINPLAFDERTPDATKASLPIFVAPYVLDDYGEGAVMGVPGHDARDFAFWKENKDDEEIRMVVEPLSLTTDGSLEKVVENGAFVHKGRLTSNCGVFAGQTSAEASENIVKLLEPNELASTAESWRLRDWLLSRQRYWGTPIPIIHCPPCGVVPVPESQLPVELPRIDPEWWRGRLGNPLDDQTDWVNTSCPSCHGPAKRETDTMDTFVDSSWYYMRFNDPHNSDNLVDPDVADKMLPVDLYIGGVEHAILHLLYARFISKFLASVGVWPAGSSPEVRGEPFKQLLTQGMVHGKTYINPADGRFVKASDLVQNAAGELCAPGSTEPALVRFEKMSKSKHNGVDPTICVSKYGADATRAHILFQAPVSEVLEWDEERISGVTRWMRRMWDVLITHIEQHPHPTFAEIARTKPREYLSQSLEIETGDKATDDSKHALDREIEYWLAVQKTIVSVTESFSKTYSLNTIVSDLMRLTNMMDDVEPGTIEPLLRSNALNALIRMSAPIMPAFAEECWHRLYYNYDTDGRLPLGDYPTVFDVPWPEPDGTLESLQSRNMPCAVQVNGKLKHAFVIPKPPEGMQGKELQDFVVGKLLETEVGKARFSGGEGSQWDVKKARKVVVVKGGRTVNFVM